MSRDFNGSNQYLRDTSYDLSAYSTISVGFWVNGDAWKTSGGQFDMLVELTADGLANTGGFTIYNDGGSGLTVGHTGSTQSAAVYSTRPSNGTWTHLLFVGDFTLSTNEVDLYLDGTLLTPSSRPFNNNNASGSTYASSALNVAVRNAASLHFDGKIAELAIWGGAALTASEVSSLADGFSPLLIRPASLRSYWPLWGRNDPEPDYVGGINLTVTAATQAAHTRIFYPTKEKIFIPAAAGGTTYTRSYSDNLAIQDAFSRLSTANRNYSDNKGISDSILRKSDANRIYSDNEGLNNPFSRQSTANRSYSDNKGLSDNYQRQSTANRNYSENEGLADNYSRTSDSNRNYTDNPALTDTYQRQSTGNRVYTDLLGLLDSFSRVSDGLRQYSDTIGIADTFSRLSNSLRQYSDTTALSDTLSRQVNSLRAYSDTTGVSDSYQRISNALRNFTDLLGITDVVTLELIAAGVYNLLVIDSLGISDNYSRTSNASRALSDNLALNDQYQRIVQNFRTLSDTLGTSDQYQRLVNHLRSITDNLGVLDTADLDIAILIIVSAVIEFIIKFNYVQSTEFKLPAVQDFTEVRFSKK